MAGERIVISSAAHAMMHLTRSYSPQPLRAQPEIKSASFNTQFWFLQGAESAGYSFRGR